METSALEYYGLIMDRLYHVLTQRLRGQIYYTLDENRGYCVHIDNDDCCISFTSDVLFSDLELNSAESNRCVLHLADKFIHEYKEYVERNIVYKVNSI